MPHHLQMKVLFVSERPVGPPPRSGGVGNGPSGWEFGADYRSAFHLHSSDVLCQCYYGGRASNLQTNSKTVKDIWMVLWSRL